MRASSVRILGRQSTGLPFRSNNEIDPARHMLTATYRTTVARDMSACDRRVVFAASYFIYHCL